MEFADAEIIKTASHKWVLLISGRAPEQFSTKRRTISRLAWLRKWKAAQKAAA